MLPSDHYHEQNNINFHPSIALIHLYCVFSAHGVSNSISGLRIVSVRKSHLIEVSFFHFISRLISFPYLSFCLFNTRTHCLHIYLDRHTLTNNFAVSCIWFLITWCDDIFPFTCCLIKCHDDVSFSPFEVKCIPFQSLSFLSCISFVLDCLFSVFSQVALHYQNRSTVLGISVVRLKEYIEVSCVKRFNWTYNTIN